MIGEGKDINNELGFNKYMKHKEKIIIPIITFITSYIFGFFFCYIITHNLLFSWFIGFMACLIALVFLLALGVVKMD